LRAIQKIFETCCEDREDFQFFSLGMEMTEYFEKKGGTMKKWIEKFDLSPKSWTQTN